MVITSIKPGKRNNIWIYADNEFLTSMPLEVFAKSRLKVGSYIDNQLLNNILNNVQEHRIKEKALNIISYRPRTKKELKDKMKDKFNEDSIDSVIDRMEESGLLNDEEYAKNYAYHLYQNKGYAVKRIRYELTHKGIDSEIISNVLENEDFDEESNLEKIIEKKNMRNIQDDKEKRRVLSYLQRLGYSWDKINSVLRS